MSIAKIWRLGALVLTSISAEPVPSVLTNASMTAPTEPMWSQL